MRWGVHNLPTLLESLEKQTHPGNKALNSCAALKDERLTHLSFWSVLLFFIRDSSIRRNFRQERLRRGFRNHKNSLTRARPRARLPRPGRRLRSLAERERKLKIKLV